MASSEGSQLIASKETGTSEINSAHNQGLEDPSRLQVRVAALEDELDFSPRTAVSRKPGHAVHDS